MESSLRAATPELVQGMCAAHLDHPAWSQRQPVAEIFCDGRAHDYPAHCFQPRPAVVIALLRLVKLPSVKC